jgi:alpha-L-fucosidase
LHAIALGWPQDGHLVIRSLGVESKVEVQDVVLLGSKEKLKWSQSAEGLTLELPASAPGKYAYSFRVTSKPSK